ncbi:MAG TPA: hypothetical protein PKM27_08455 [Saprospiraceae bacterium]|nr:hypothetical protein [Saprospiraceae bacterium]
MCPRYEYGLGLTLFLLFTGCVEEARWNQDIFVLYHIHKIKSLSMIRLPEDYRIKSFDVLDDHSSYQVKFRLDYHENQIRDMSDRFRQIRRESSGPGWGKYPAGWEFFHQPLLDEQFILRIDTLAGEVEYSYMLLY